MVHVKGGTTMKRTLMLMLVLGAFATLTGAAGAADSYTDAVGDNKSAPDVRQVSVVDGGNGTVLVAIDLDADISAGATLLMGIDSDRNTATGAPCGCDYMVVADEAGVGLGKWLDGAWSPFPHQGLNPMETGGRLTFTLTLADLGGTTAFDYWVAGVRGDDIDYAPDDGVFTFPQQAAKPEIRSVVINATSLLPRAGKIFTIPPVQVMLTSSEIVTSDSMTCSLTYKGKLLAQRAPCSWKIPSALRNKKLRLSLTVVYQGATSSVAFPVSPR
jgi:hypothetical protein